MINTSPAGKHYKKHIYYSDEKTPYILLWWEKNVYTTLMEKTHVYTTLMGKKTYILLWWKKRIYYSDGKNPYILLWWKKTVYTTLMEKKTYILLWWEKNVYTTLTGVCPRDRGMLKKLRQITKKSCWSDRKQKLSFCTVCGIQWEIDVVQAEVRGGMIISGVWIYNLKRNH